MSQHQRQCHWDDRYRTTGGITASWFEAEPQLSLELIELVGAAPGDSIIDLGGGTSSLTARLQQRGYTDPTVLDVSAQALETAKQGVEHPEEVAWIRADLLSWSPARCWNVWHDRAVFHFLVDPDERRTYRELLRRSLSPGGAVIVATFAEDGPTTCSSLPVQRYSADHLVAEIGPGFTENGSGRFEHVTPSGAIQPFVWVALTAERT